MKLLVQTSLRLLLALMPLTNIMSICSAEDDILSRKQARNYIGHVVKTLFSSLHSASYAEEIELFTRDTVTALKTHSYTAHELYPLIIDRAIKFIERKSVKYAEQEIQKLHHKNNKYLAKNIAQNIAQEARSVINRSSVLPENALAPFVGANLRSKVQQLIKHGSQAKKVRKPKHETYACPVCYEHYGAYHERISLICGHAMCVDCLNMMEKHKGHVVLCPLCKTSIHVCDYRNRMPVNFVTAPVVTAPVTYTTVGHTYYKPIEIVQPGINYTPVYTVPKPQNWVSFDFGFKL